MTTPEWMKQKPTDEQCKKIEEAYCDDIFRELITAIYYVSQDRSGGAPCLLAERLGSKIGESPDIVQRVMLDASLKMVRRVECMQARDALARLQRDNGKPARPELEVMREIFDMGHIVAPLLSKKKRLANMSKWLKVERVDNETREAVLFLSDLGCSYMARLSFIEKNADTCREEIAAASKGKRIVARENRMSSISSLRPFVYVDGEERSHVGGRVWSGDTIAEAVAKLLKDRPEFAGCEVVIEGLTG